MSAEAAPTAEGYVRELGELALPQLQPLWTLKANNKLLVIPFALSCVQTSTQRYSSLQTSTHTHTGRDPY